MTRSVQGGHPTGNHCAPTQTEHRLLGSFGAPHHGGAHCMPVVANGVSSVCG